MVTEPAHSLLAPAIARLIAAARVMPGVCGVFESSLSLEIIFTPLLRQSIFIADLIFPARQPSTHDVAFKIVAKLQPKTRLGRYDQLTVHRHGYFIEESE